MTALGLSKQMCATSSQSFLTEIKLILSEKHLKAEGRSSPLLSSPLMRARRAQVSAATPPLPSVIYFFAGVFVLQDVASGCVRGSFARSCSGLQRRQFHPISSQACRSLPAHIHTLVCQGVCRKSSSSTACTWRCRHLPAPPLAGCWGGRRGGGVNRKTATNE